MTDEDYRRVAITICITSIVILTIVSFTSYIFDSEYKKSLCIGSNDKYYEVVKCQNDIKNYNLYQTVKYFVKFEENKNDNNLRKNKKYDS